MSKTFFALLDMAELPVSSKEFTQPKVHEETRPNLEKKEINQLGVTPSLSGLHYNIQIHLPATKDVEVYNAIFKSLKDHFVD